jgi:hypothetical protein
MDGWNGRICRNPAANTFCVGDYSYPGDQIKVGRDLDWERANAGRSCAQIDGIPPCVYSINAFGRESVTANSHKPDWYPADEVEWTIPASTICIWPYEEMYREEVVRHGKGQKYDYDKRIAYADEYFSHIEEGRSLVFYYANYSNPFSEDDAKRYVIVGMSRLKSLGKPRYYSVMADDDRQQYGGGFVWARDLTSHYPDEGFRLPYHAYVGDPDTVERFLVSPPNPRNFKYATRQFSDDDALELVERLIESVGALRGLGDISEDWSVRIDWLHSVVGELWTQRGLFPGMPAVLEHLGLARAIGVFKEMTESGDEKQAKELLLGFAAGGVDSVPDLDFTPDEVKAIRRRWKLLDADEQRPLGEVLVRFELSREQVERLLSEERFEHSVTASVGEMCANPFVISEQYIGDGADDTISFARIDHGALPSPELGGEPLADPDDWRRLRALCVEALRREPADVFLPAAGVIHDVNHRLSFHPEWKRHQFSERYLEADRDELEGALVIRDEAGARWLYL